MSNLALFPLNLVAFPGEKLNLHIFEPRYLQLVNECVDTSKPFGIPTFLHESLPGYGTEMKILEIAHRYDDGRMDIRAKGQRVFRILDYVNPTPGKLYAAGEVDFYEPETQEPLVVEELLTLLRQLYVILKSPLKFDPALPQPFSYQIGHGIGLSLESEYELLTITRETERQLFLIAHLQEVVPVMQNMEATKERIQMNGHFREFGPLDWE